MTGNASTRAVGTEAAGRSEPKISTPMGGASVSEVLAFRAELTKIMPGYSWTVHRPHGPTFLKATGIQSSGFNRLSTLAVTRRQNGDAPVYEAKSAGYGTRAKWLHTNSDATLARALRGLQQHYEATANTYRSHAAALQSARQASNPTAEGV